MSIAHPLGDKSSLPPNPSEAPTRPDTWTLVGWWMDKRVEWVRTLAVARPAMLQWTLNSNTSPLETEERASIFNKHEYIRVKAGKYSTQCKLLTRNYTRVILLVYLYLYHIWSLSVGCGHNLLDIFPVCSHIQCIHLAETWHILDSTIDVTFRSLFSC